MSEVFKIALETSVSAGIVALMVIAARLIAGRRPNPVLRIFFVLLIIRLAVPVSVPSPLSIQNLFSIQASQTEQVLKSPIFISNEANDTAAEPLQEKEQSNGGNTQAANVTGNDKINDGIGHTQMSLMDICIIIWLWGIAVFSIIMTFGNVRFSRSLKRNRGYDFPGFEELLSECKKEMGLRQKVRTVQSSAINTAAVYGVFRPRLLISPSFESLSNAEKRHVLLHELSHIKRKDNPVCLLASVLSIIYWYNPLIWAAFALMKRDIEVTCDAQALKRIGDRRAYAQTLIHLAESTNKGKPRLVPALFISTDAIKRRIKMIVENKKNPIFYTIIGLILVVVTAVCGCTGAATQPSQVQQPTASPAVSQQTTPAASDLNVLTLNDGSISVNIPQGWHAKDLSDDTMNSEGQLVSDDGKNKIEINCKSATGEINVTTESVIGQSVFICVDGEGGVPSDSSQSTITYVASDEGALGQTTITYSMQSGTEVWTFDLQDGSGETLTVNGIEGKIYNLYANNEGGKKQGRMAVFTANGKVYTISYFADSEEFEKNKDTVESVISSAKFN